MAGSGPASAVGGGVGRGGRGRGGDGGHAAAAPAQAAGLAGLAERDTERQVASHSRPSDT